MPRSTRPEVSVRTTAGRALKWLRHAYTEEQQPYTRRMIEEAVAEAEQLGAARPNSAALDVEALAEALKEYDAGRLPVKYYPGKAIGPGGNPTRFHRAWAEALQAAYAAAVARRSA